MERRLGQKRKERGGRSLEDATSMILDHFKFKSSAAPFYFQADIEIDKWIMTKRKFYIGISCKKTLRERWKQVSSANTANMGRYKIASFYTLLRTRKICRMINWLCWEGTGISFTCQMTIQH